MIKQTFRLVLVAAYVAGTGAILSACNTVEGVGKDVSAGGKAVSGAAKNVKKKL